MRALACVFACVWLAGAVMVSAPAHAQTARVYGLTVGIDDYAAEAPLQGAVNDARDVRAALLDFGAVEVRTLINRDATRAAIEGAYFALLDRAARGDVIVFAFAGHGLRLAELVPGSNRDGLDEAFIMGGFDRNRPATHGEIIRDKTLREWFEIAVERGVTIILVADSCHAGGMDRSAGLRGASRFAPPFLPPGHVPVETGPGFVTGDDPPENVTMLAAVEASQKVNEHLIDGQWRGVLSYVVARGLRGAADLNGDGRISRFELETYVLSQVRSITDDIQHPLILPRAARDAPLLERSSAAPAPPEAAVLRPVSLGAQGGALPSGLSDIVAGASEPVLTYLTRERQVRNRAGEVVAHNIAPGALQSVIHKYQLITWLRERAERRPLVIESYPETSQSLSAGDMIAFTITRSAREHFAVFNLANNGEVQYLQSGPRTRMVFEIVPPYGSDHLVVVASDRALPALEARLRAGINIEALRLQLPALIGDADVDIGMATLHTRE